MMKDKAILLLNIGSPDSPETGDVRRYLRRFLSDGRVISMPGILRWLLVNCIIAPFRAPKSAKLYRMLWTPDSAPLIYYTRLAAQKLQDQTDDADVYFAMRYGKPEIKTVLNEIKTKNYKRLTVIPLFPQYASSSTGTAIQAVTDYVGKWTVIPQLSVIQEFFRNPLFIAAFAERIQQYKPETYDHIIFSFHGLPISHIEAMCKGKSHDDCQCEHTDVQPNNTCYKSACYETARLIAQKLNVTCEQYTVAFQSRLSKNWLMPFTDKVIKGKARQGTKKLLVVAPSFVADCLETTVEIGFEYKKLFEINGGKKFTLVESLNDSDTWVKALKDIAESR